MRTLPIALAAAVLAPLVLAACDVGDVRPTDVEGARIVLTSPDEGARDVDRLAPMRVVYEQPLGPRGLEGATVELRSGDRRVGVRARLDPTLPGLTIAPVVALEPGVRWTLVVSGATDLDGRVAEPARVVFFTGERATPIEASAPGWDEIGPLLEARCARCHGGEAAVLGLDLGSAEGVRRTAIGVGAEQTGGASAYGVARVGLAGLPRIDAIAGGGHPERSYLVYKVLGDPHVLGAPMPPPDEDGGSAGPGGVTRAEAQRIAQWIRAGAPTSLP